MFSKHLILLLLNICLCLSKPIPPGNYKKMVIPAGSPLKFTCTGSGKMNIFYPKSIKGLTESSAAIISESATQPSALTFERPKTVIGDSGWYGCVEESKNELILKLNDSYVTPDDDDGIDWFYVYVNIEVRPRGFKRK